MILGILSDTHGHVERCAQAVALLERLGATAFAHCGDVGGEAVLDIFAGRTLWFVWGNTDWADARLANYARAIGITPPDDLPRLFEFGGRRLALCHGHEPGFRQWPAELDADYLLHGHTHVYRDERHGRLRIINPGALQRAHRYTVATLAPRTDDVRFWDLSESLASGAPVPAPHEARPTSPF
jgi:putative phosphoesterase